MTAECGEGLINIRVGAIIRKNDSFLMAGNDVNNYLYSIGGRVRFNETAEEAVIREVKEETGVQMEVDHLGFVHENYFFGDSKSNMGKTVYEICFYFYMKVPENFEFRKEHTTESGIREYLSWVRPDCECFIFPEFFREELLKEDQGVRHIVSDERFRLGSKVTVSIDRPLGSHHPEYPDMIYPVNYGYVKGLMAGDGEWQDAYVLGVDDPVEEFTGQLAAVIRRSDDTEDKWVVVPYGMVITKEEIEKQTAFQEQYYHSVIEM